MRRRSRQGIALVWTALVLIVMIGMVGLSIDWGKVVWNVQQIQNAADAAALAGAQVVKTHTAQAVTLAANMAHENYADGRPVTLQTAPQPEPFAGDQDAYGLLLGRWVTYNRTFIPTEDAPNAVRAVVHRRAGHGADSPPLALVFGPMFGRDTLDATRAAVAACLDSSGAGVICLDAGARPGLEISGTANLDVDGGGIHVNATVEGTKKNTAAASVSSGSAELDCGFLNVVGSAYPAADSADWAGISPVGGFSVQDCTTYPAPQPVADPLAAAMVGGPYVAGIGDHLDLPALINDGTIPTINIPTVSATCTLSPGYYPNGIRMTSSGATVTLAPTSESGLGTLFVFGGAGLYVNGGNLNGRGVTCYVTKNFNTGQVGAIDLRGNGVIELWSPGDWRNRGVVPPDLSIVQGLNGIALWQDPTTGTTPDPWLNGGGTLNIAGALYFPDPIHLVVRGNLEKVGNQIVCGSADFSGTGTIRVHYDGRNGLPPSYSSHLVK
ncbi:MAG: pilus assembly protein [Phycisphaerae bacterium]|nr:pilus assembly protein [Phycisphaerae bacterium]